MLSTILHTFSQRMFKKLILLLTLTLGLTHANSFDLVKVEPKNTTVFEGSDLDLFCGANDYFGFCSFVHSDKKCEFQWKKSSWNFTDFSCPGNPFGNQAVLIEGLYKNETCGIRLKNVTKVKNGILLPKLVLAFHCLNKLF